MNTQVSPGFPPSADSSRRAWPFSTLALIALAAGAAIFIFHDAVFRLYDIYAIKPEYSHGTLIPIISAFLLWRERAWIATAKFEGSWTGLVLIVGGLALWLLGDFATIFTIQQYAFLVVLYGCVVAFAGWAVFRHLWMPLLILIFMVPLPAFFSNTLSLQMQLISSELGVAVVRLAGISVFLEGNVIDLGTYKLQVAEACDGLRYVFPLMTLAFIMAYLYRAPLWKRAILFASSVPIAILMNSFRIGVIGITVEYWGQRMAEGVLHDFEGWVVFMLSTVVLLLVAALLCRIGAKRVRLRDVLIMDSGPRIPREGVVYRPVPRPFVATAVILAGASVLAVVVPSRAEIIPTRTHFVEYPNHLGPWQGRQGTLDKVYTDWLVLDDYLLADYRRSDSPIPINLYVAYYDSQRSGQAVHSPRSCLPGGGWDMKSFEQRSLPDVRMNGAPLQVNRAVIMLGNQRQVVYYWFQQRGRVITSELQVKWYIFWDALTRNRTDGAMVRLVAPVPTGMSDEAADTQLAAMAQQITRTLDQYVPG